MSQTFGIRMQGVATSLLSKYGDATVTFTRVTPGAFIPTTGGAAAGSTLTYTSQGVSTNYNSQEINNTTILYTDLKYLIKVTTQTPAVNDTVVLEDGQTYRVMSVLQENVQDVDICWTVQLRI
jgi:hypothetical protein